MDLSFWKGKRVFLTGHTGFKGSWLCKILAGLGSELTGYSLSPQTEPSLFYLSGIENKMTSVTGDIRDKENLLKVFNKAQPEVVIHMAAQPLVRESYQNPSYTYEVNVMGTVNILECVRLSNTVNAVLNVTTDKVYYNNEWQWGYRETDTLGGFDPYSNSKSCSEFVTQSYINSFFAGTGISVSTARAGNVIGGGDFAENRIVPDCIRAALKNDKIIVRNPNAVRPFQHVLEPLFAYLMLIQNSRTGCYNVGPDDSDCISVGILADYFCKTWGEGLHWAQESAAGPHEAQFLKLDCSKIKSDIGWVPHWNVKTAIDKTVEWAKAHLNNCNPGEVMDAQILQYMEGKND